MTRAVGQVTGWLGSFPAILGSVALLIAERPTWIWRRVPKSTIAFLLIAALSIAWSFYPGASLLGVVITLITTFVGVVLALCLNWDRFIRTLAGAIKWVLVLSLVLELWVA